MSLNKINQYEVSPQDSFLFDTNVWVFVFGPIAGADSKKQSIYAGLLRDIQNRGAKVFITSLVISEYINLVLRIGFHQWMKATGLFNADFKHDYRPTDRYKEDLNDAIHQVIEILKITDKRNDDFMESNIQVAYANMQRGCDYNDAYMVRYCKDAGFTLVTDDSDIVQFSNIVNVLTR